MRSVLVLAVVIAAGCGGGAHRQPVGEDWRSALRDAMDGRLDRAWSCPALRTALRRLPAGGGPVYSTVPVLVGRAAAESCDAALGTLRVGMTSAAVRQRLGRPDTTGRCWVLRWPPVDAGARPLHGAAGERSPVDGARVCFDHGHVSQLQTAVHG